MKHVLASLGPKVTASRMVRDYVTELYEPAAAQAVRIAADGYAPRAELSAVEAPRPGRRGTTCGFASVASDTGSVELGSDRHVVAQVRLGSLTPDDVEVQLLHGPVGAGDELVDPTVVPLTFTGPDGDDGVARYEGIFRCAARRPLRLHGPGGAAPPGLTCPVELGRIAWA